MFPLTSLEEDVKISAYDQDFLYDDFLGMNIFKFTQLAQFEKESGWV